MKFSGGNLLQSQLSNKCNFLLRSLEFMAIILLLSSEPRCSSGANAGGRAFCHELDIGWVHIVQWIFSISAISDWLFWRKGVFCVFYIIKSIAQKGYFGQKYP